MPETIMLTNFLKASQRIKTEKHESFRFKIVSEDGFKLIFQTTDQYYRLICLLVQIYIFIYISAGPFI